MTRHEEGARVRVDLIQAPLPDRLHRFIDAVHPPLGLLSLAAVLREAGHDCRVLDLRLPGPPLRTLRRAWARRRPQVIGVSTPTVASAGAVELVRYCKTRLPDVPVVLGGPHATAYGGEVLGSCPADVLVRGEGEPVIVALVERLAAGKEPTPLPGVFGADRAQPDTGERVLQESLDELPFPAWELIDLDAYSRFPSSGFSPRRRYATIMGSRGCPLSCAYCQKLFGRTWRTRSPARLVDELEYVVSRFGVTTFEILDDLFGLDIARLEEICRLIRDRRLDIELWFSTNGLRPDHLDRHKLDLLREAGTQMIMFPIDSGSPRIQHLMERDLDLGRARAMISHADSLDILCGGFFMLGFPTETREEMMQTVDVAVNSDLHLATFLAVTAYEGSPLAARFPHHTPRDARLVNNDYGTATFDGVSLATVNEVRRLAYGRFLSRPRRLRRLLDLYPSKRDLPLAAGTFAARSLRRGVVGSALLQRLLSRGAPSR